MGTEVLTNKKYDYICRYRPKASGSGRDECREIYPAAGRIINPPAQDKKFSGIQAHEYV